MRVDFYHLTADPAPRALAALAARAATSGQRMLVVSEDAGQREAISRALWSAPGFLAHGEDGEPGADRQPLLIGEHISAPANGAPIVALADGRWREEAGGFARALLLFDDSRIEQTRACWRSLGNVETVERHYWKQNGGRWTEGP